MVKCKEYGFPAEEVCFETIQYDYYFWCFDFTGSLIKVYVLIFLCCCAFMLSVLFQFFIPQNEIVCTAFIAAQYLKTIGYKDKVYLIGKEDSIGKELQLVGINYTGTGVSKRMVLYQ